MSVRYAPIPSPRNEQDTDPELDAAFDDSDDEENVHQSPNDVPPLTAASSHDQSSSHTYDFNSPIPDHDYNYDLPPPGSPPPPTSLAMPNSIGNSNGIVPTSTLDAIPKHSTSWWRRTAGAVLPSYYVDRFGLTNSSGAGRTRVMGGGTGNDGVFSNVSAKPSTTGVRVQEGDNIFIVPEETSTIPPPSYASAQADAAPPYHTSTLLLPLTAHSLSTSFTQGSVIVDTLPTGTLFAFLWNALVSTTFQFIGFVLTWVMHTTHAAKFGSRAGLGITLIQWGFGLRSRLEDTANGGSTSVWGDANGRPSFGSTKEAEDYYNSLGLLNFTATDIPTQGMDQLQEQWDGSALTGPLATEWLSFFLMTAGWFLLLTSSLGFWRVKRWERSILASNSSSSAGASSSPGHMRTRSEAEDENETRRQSLFERLGLFDASALRQPTEHDGGVGSEVHLPLMPLDGNDGEGGVAPGGTHGGGQAGAAQDEGAHRYSDPERARRLREAIENEQRLCRSLRYAGLL